jgi:hypothetical protein
LFVLNKGQSESKYSQSSVHWYAIQHSNRYNLVRLINLKTHNTNEEWEEHKIELLIIRNESFELLLSKLRSKNQFSLLVVAVVVELVVVYTQSLIFWVK